MKDITSITQKDKAYPPLLKEIPNPPKKLFVRGTLPSFDVPWIAIVGTRKATEESLKLAKKIAKELAQMECVIVSGLALGIDTAAHEGALLAKTVYGEPGRTVAVLGNGIDHIYPRQNQRLGEAIIDGHGALISEYEGGMPAMPHQFLERNRIVAGLCIATVVIEAPVHSGAIVTARHSGQYGRYTFVFPGPAGHPQFKGSHALIRDGAILADSLSDIFEDLGFEKQIHTKGNARKQNFFLGNAGIVYGILENCKDGVTLDELIEKSNLDVETVNREVTELMLQKKIKEVGALYKAI